MPKIQLNGFLQEISNVQFVGANGTPKQEIVLLVPGFTNNFGEKIGQDDLWKISILGESIDKFNLYERHAGTKVKTEVYISSRQYTSKKDNSIGYIVNVNLASIEFLTSSQRSAANEPRTPTQTIADPNRLPDEYFENRSGEENGDLPF
jgi:hypothetical protein